MKLCRLGTLAVVLFLGMWGLGLWHRTTFASCDTPQCVNGSLWDHGGCKEFKTGLTHRF